MEEGACLSLDLLVKVGQYVRWAEPSSQPAPSCKGGGDSKWLVISAFIIGGRFCLPPDSPLVFQQSYETESFSLGEFI